MPRPSIFQRLASFRSQLLLAAVVLACVAVWIHSTRSDVQADTSDQVRMRAEAALAPFSMLLDDAANRLAEGVASDRVIGSVQVERLSEISLGPEGDAALTNLLAHRWRSVSLPFKEDGAWRAIMIDPQGESGPDQLAAVIDLKGVFAAWERLRVDFDASVAIATVEGELWWRTPMLEGLVGKDVSQGPFFQVAKESSAATGFAKIQAINTDGEERMIGWRRVDRFGFYVTSSRKSSAVTALWFERFSITLLMAGFLIVAACLILAQTTGLQRARRAAQHRAAESERLLADWSANTAHVVWETASDHTLNRFHASAGVDEDALEGLIGRTFWERPGAPHPEEDPTWARVRSAMNARLPFQDFEHVYLEGDTLQHFRTSGAPLFDDSGAFAGYRGVSVNIDSEKAATEALQESQAALEASERLLRTVIDQLPSTVSVKDPDGKLVLFNKRFGEIFGISTTDGAGIGKTMGQAFPDSIGPAIEGRDRAVLESKQPLELERTAGDYVLHIMKSPLLDDDEECIGIVTIGYDITERRRSETKLAQSERRLAHFVELLPAGAAYIEAGRMTVNGAAETIAGRDRTELTTTEDWFEKAVDGDADAARRAFETAREGGFVSTLRQTVRRPNGVQREVEIVAYKAGSREV